MRKREGVCVCVCVGGGMGKGMYHHASSQRQMIEVEEIRARQAGTYPRPSWVSGMSYLYYDL